MKYVVANWKMHAPALGEWVKTLTAQPIDDAVELVLCPPFTTLGAAQVMLASTAIGLGAQDCHAQLSGAHTGDISAEMLKKAGCHYVIIGHSERREQHGETNAQVRAKAQAAQAQGLIPIICVGESLEEREMNAQEEIVSRQLTESLPVTGDMIVAYEPVWAIGTGRCASHEEIAAMHRFIKKKLDDSHPVLYGGSVKAGNAADILALEGVDGVLVGSASLNADELTQIVRAAH